MVQEEADKVKNCFVFFFSFLFAFASLNLYVCTHIVIYVIYNNHYFYYSKGIGKGDMLFIHCFHI